MSNTILLCGGPADGQWRVVQDPSKDFEIMTQGRINWQPDPAETEIPGVVKTTYRIFRETIFGMGLWVAVPRDEDRPRLVIMRTVLQRDVAQHLEALS